MKRIKSPSTVQSICLFIFYFNYLPFHSHLKWKYSLYGKRLIWYQICSFSFFLRLDQMVAKCVSFPSPAMFLWGRKEVGIRLRLFIIHLQRRKEKKSKNKSKKITINKKKYCFFSFSSSSFSISKKNKCQRLRRRVQNLDL